MGNGQPPIIERRFVVLSNHPSTEGKFLTKSNTWGDFKFARVFNTPQSCQMCIDRHGGIMKYCELVLGGL